MLDERRRAEAWKTRALDAEAQRDRAEAEVAHAGDAFRMLAHLVVSELERLDGFEFAAEKK